MYYQRQIDFTPKEVIAYSRKSQSDDPSLTVEEVLAKHETLLDEWAERNLGSKVPEENKYREVVSGETLKERPQIQIVLKRIESPQIKAIEIVEPQRLTRGDLEDIGRIMKLLKHTNTLVVTIDKIYDLRDEYDWNAFEAELKRGNDYLNYYKKIQDRGKNLSFTSGNYLGSIPPYGYEKTTVIVDKRKCPTLKIKEDEAQVVKMIFDMYVNKDMGRTSIANRLDELGITPPKGERWSPASLKDMLENVHYLGKVKRNWRKIVTIVEDGEIINTRPKAKIGEFLICEGKHEAIISEELFMAARAKQGRNHRAKAKTKIRNPLAGLLWCQCGRAMSLRFYKRKDGSEKSPPRLLCDDQAHCKTTSCLYDEMIDEVVRILQQCIEDFEIRLQNDDGSSAKLHASLVKTLEKKMKDLEAQELSQWKRQSHPDESLRMPEHIFKQLNENLLKEKDEVQQALCKAYESMPEPVNYEDKLYQFKDALETLKDPDAPADKKNKLLKACIERIDYNREKTVRLTRKNCTDYGIDIADLKTGGNWYTPPMELDVKLKV